MLVEMPPEKTKDIIEGLRVTVVDDNKDARDLVELYLKFLNADVKPVSSAEKALETIESFQPHIVISDICMPEKDGYWSSEQLRKAALPYIRAIALTVAAREEDRERLLLAGYDAYLAKPFLFEDLNGLITQLMAANN